MHVYSHELDQHLKLPKNLSQKSMEIISSSVSSSTRQKISSNSDDNNNIFTSPSTNSDEDQHSNTEDNHTAFEFKFDHHQSANSNADSPGSPFKDSPADHLFRNGILLPHSFPVQPMCYYYYGSERRNYSYQRSASRTSSVGSKDSLFSSRSNSTNSRSSSSSARTSVSDTNSERKHFYNNAMREYHKRRPQPVILDQVYGSSRRWQFITPMPVMTQEPVSSRPKKQKLEPQEHVNITTAKKVRTKKKSSATGSGSCFCSWPILKFFQYILSVCRECHALEPSVQSVSSIHEIPSQ